MKSILLISLMIISSATFASTLKLEPATILSVKSNNMFPVTTLELSAQIACYETVIGTLSTVESDGNAIVGIMVKSNLKPGAPVCMGLSKKKFKVTVSAPIIRDIKVLGAVQDLVIQ